jgi:hypothetical protein
MKFKYIIIGFNILIIFFLLVIIVTSVTLLGASASKFWVSGWPLVLILLASLIGLNVFFLLNRRLFLLLEREDWPALVDYLERQVYERGRYSSRLVRLLANSYVILSDSAGVLRLEKKISLSKPALLDSNALVFGAAHILGGSPAGAAAFFSARLENGRPREPQWVRMFYGFSLLLSRVFDKAETEFRTLALSSDDAIITGLSAWFLSETLGKFSANPKDCRAVAEQGRLRLRQRLKKVTDWRKEAAKIETGIHAAVFKKYIEQSEEWLFQEGHT